MLDDMVDRIRTLLEARGLSTTQFADAIEVSRPVISHILSGRNKPSLEVVQKILAAFPDLAMAWLLNGTEPMLTDMASATATPAAGNPPVSARPPAGTAVPLQAEVPSALASRQTSASAAAPPAQPFRAPVTIGPDSAPIAPKRPAMTPIRPFMKRFDQEKVKVDLLIGGALHAPATPAVPASSPAQPATPAECALPTDTLLSPPPPVSSVTPVPTSDLGTADPAASPFAVPGKTIRRIVIFYHDGSFADFQPE